MGWSQAIAAACLILEYPVLAAPPGIQLTANITSNPMNSTHHSSSTTSNFVKWAPEPRERGTYSILSTCLILIFTSTWLVCSMGIPPSTLTPLQVQFHKFNFYWKCLVFPDFVLCAFSGNDFLIARRIQKAVSQLCPREKFTLAHAYYLIMGGFVVQDPDSETLDKDLVISPDCFVWLLESHLVSWDRTSPSGARFAYCWQVSEKEIWARSGSDGLGSLFVFLQILWFFVQIVSRWAAHLPVSALEFVTLAYLFCYILSYVLWWHKPKNVKLRMRKTLPPMTDEQKQRFLSLKREMAQCWQFNSFRPVQGCFHRDQIIRVCGFTLILVIYGSIYLAGSTSAFPNEDDRWLWRVYSLTMIGSSAIMPVVLFYGPKWKAFDLPRVICSFNCFMRLILVYSMFRAFRSEPPRLYEVVPFTNYFPHLI